LLFCFGFCCILEKTVGLVSVLLSHRPTTHQQTYEYKNNNNNKNNNNKLKMRIVIEHCSRFSFRIGNNHIETKGIQ
jgi:hypothetical protein